MGEGHDDILGVPLAAPIEAPPRVRAQDFERFLGEHYPLLVRFLRRRTTTMQDAEDAAQESLARLLRYRDAGTPTTWKPLLYRIATNVAHDQSRQAAHHRQQAHVPLEAPEADAAADQVTPERRLAEERELEQVLAAIRALPEKCRQVFLLSRFHGMSNPDIARRCGISVRMVEKQISKALAACRSRVRDRGP